MHRIAVLSVCLAALASQTSCGDGSRTRTAADAQSLPATEVGFIKKMYKGSQLDVDADVDNDRNSFVTYTVKPGVHKVKLTIHSFPDYHYSGPPIVHEWDMPVKVGWQNEVSYDVEGEHRVELIYEEVNLANPKEFNKVVVKVVKL